MNATHPPRRPRSPLAPGESGPAWAGPKSATALPWPGRPHGARRTHFARHPRHCALRTAYPAGRTYWPSLTLGLALSLSCWAGVAGGAEGSEARKGLNGEWQLANTALRWHWRLADGRLTARLEDRRNQETLDLPGEAFRILLDDGRTLQTSDFTPEGPPQIQSLKPDPGAATLARHLGGRQLVARFRAPDQNLLAEWRAILPEGASWVREQLTLRAADQDVLVKELVLFAQTVPGARTVGTVDGSPVAAGTFFFGYEHPMARNTVDARQVVSCRFQRNAVLKSGESLVQSCVVGTVPRGQLRRGFLAYLEHERARPYHPFLHYNSWYDIAWGNRKFDEPESLAAIAQFGRELTQKRGVRLDSFLFDDGWDDNQTLWQFHSGFPNGFTPLMAAAARWHTAIGVWLSPFGGYGSAREQRLAFASSQGYETNASGFSLAGPRYYGRFHDICLEMVRKYGVNAFKFDGLAAGGKAAANGLTRDGDAMLRLIAELRAARPGLYINQTTGTWPSPFWLLYVDSTWRGGDDFNFAGKGPFRQQWITYRDRETFRRVVQGGPLYPLNSLMIHGPLYALNANHLNQAEDQEFADELHDYFGSGTQLQELYLTPRLLNPQNWDDLAEAARWSRANADVLLDTHWIGGDPGKSEVYGWASWTPHKAILVLRNPDDQPARFTADVRDLFELPTHAATRYRMHSPWKKNHDAPPLKLDAGRPFTATLQPFEVLVLEGK